MAQVTFIEINGDGIIVGIHDTNPSALPEGHSIEEKTVIDPLGLLGLSVTQIDTLPEDRIKINVLSEKELLRSKLKDMSLELDFKTRMGEDTTDLLADFNRDKVLYDAMP